LASYTFHDLWLDVRPDGIEARARLAPFWPSLSLVPAEGAPNGSHRIYVRLHEGRGKLPPTVHKLSQAGEFSLLRHEDSYYLTDNSCVFQLRPADGCGDAYLTASFFNKPRSVQYSFWSFGWLKLLRPLGFYTLHAAGLVSPAGMGVLVIGPPGSGKSTLALGLIRRGWRYLTDDAVLIHPWCNGVRALALRAHFYIDACAAPANADLPLGGTASGHECDRRRVLLENTALGSQHTRACMPGLLIFPRIVQQDSSVLTPIKHRIAFKNLLDASGPQLFDYYPQTMRQHFEVLKRLLVQSNSLELLAGLDLYHNPEVLVRLLAEVRQRG
jgi:hypothetical protein